VLAEQGESERAIELAQRGAARAEAMPEADRSGEWNYGTALVFTNLAECLVTTARDSNGSADTRRARIDAARAAWTKARERMHAAQARDELGADEEEHFAYIADVEAKATAVLETLPAQ
jgi:hypothetical protein